MSVEQLPSKAYRVRYFDAHGRKRSKTFTRKGDAKEWESQIVRAKQRGKLGAIDADLQPLSELVAEHFAARTHLAARTLSTDIDVWASNVDQRVRGNPQRQDFHPIAEMPLRMLTVKVIEEWRDEKLKEGKGVDSVKKALLVMQSALKRAMHDEKIDKNPASLVPKPTKAARDTLARVSPREVELIRKQLDAQGALLVGVLAYAGVRPSECLALAWRHVGANVLHIERATNPDGSFKATKTKRNRSVRLVAPLADDLKRWRKVHPGNDDDLIFGPDAWSKSDWENWRKRKFNAAAKAAKVEIDRPYDLRGAAGSLWLYETNNTLVVSSWLGHSVATLEKDYASVIPDLDPNKRVDAAKTIRAARKNVGTTWAP